MSAELWEKWVESVKIGSPAVVVDSKGREQARGKVTVFDDDSVTVETDDGESFTVEWHLVDSPDND